jgi:hypothetical protein
MGAALKLKPETVRLSGPREALAGEIETVAAISDRLEALRRANGDEAVFRARQVLESAQASLAEAAAADMEAAKDFAVYGGSKPAPSAPAARQRVEAAEAELTDARRIRDELKAEASELEKRLASRWRMPELIGAVLQDEAGPTVDALMGEIEALQLRLVEKAATLSVLVVAGAAPGIVDRQYTRTGRLHTQVRGLTDLFEIKPAAVEAAEWSAAIKALEADADARLPL